MPTTIYIFGNLQVFQSALVGLQMIFNPANNTDWAVGGALFGVGPIVTIGLLFSLLHLTTKGIWTQKMHLHHVGILLGLYSAMFVPQTSVQVQDIYSGQTVVVDGIPIGVAWPAAIVSQLAYDAATQLGQAFQQASATAPPTDLSQGFADPLKQMLELRKLYGNYVKMSPAMASNEFSFFQQCVYPMYTQDTSLMLAYNTSPDLFQTVTNTNYVTGATATSAGTPMQATILGGAGNALCSSGACAITCNALASGLATQYTNWFGGAGANSCSSAAALATSSSSSTQKPVTDCNATNMGGLLSQLGSNGNEYISQMIHTCMGAAGMSAGNQLLSGNPDSTVLPSYCVLQQNTLNQFQVDNANSASLFLKNMLSMMSILQFLFIALAPLAAFTMVMAGAQGLATFMKYIMFGLWTQSWLPVAALLNDYAQMTLSHQLAVIGQAVTGNAGNITAAVNAITLSGMPPAPANGLTITTIPAVLESVMQQLSIVNMMMAMTPIITMIVFTGSYMAMSSLADGITKEIDQHGGKNTGLEAPSLEEQKKAFGVSAPGNSAGSYMVTDGAYDGAGFSYGSALSAGVSASEQRAATASNSYATSVGHQASYTMGMMNQYGEKFSNTAAFNTKGGHELSNAWKSMQGFAKDTNISSDQLANYAAQYKGQLDLGASPAKALATVMSRVKKAFGQAAGGLTGTEENKIATAIKNSEVQKAANDLTSGESAKLITEASRQLGVDKAENDSQSLNQQVADTKNAQATAQQAISKANTLKQEAQQQASVSGSEQINQGILSAKAASNGQALNDTLATKIAMGSSDPMKALSEYRSKRDWLSTHTSMSGEALTAAALTLAGAQDAGNLGVAVGQYVYGNGFGGKVPQAADALNKRVDANYSQAAHAVTTGTNSLKPAETNANNAEKHVPADVNAGLKKGQQVKGAATATTNAHTPEGEYNAGTASVNAHKVGGFSPEFQNIAQQVNDAPSMPILKWAQEHPEEYVAALAAANAAGPLASMAVDLGKKAWGALKSFGPAAAGAGAAAAGAGEAAAGAAVAAGAGEAAAGAAAASAAGAGATATVATLGATVVAGAAAAVGVGVAGGVGLAIGTGLNYAPKLFGSNETLSDMLAGGADQLLHGDTASGKVWQEGYNKAIQTPQYKENQAKIKDLMASGATMDNPEVKSLVQDNVQLINGTVADIVNPPPRDGAVVPAI